MHGSPDAKQHGNNTCAQDIKGPASARTRNPMHYVSAVAKKKRAHNGF